MEFLHRGFDQSAITLWLRHESVKITHNDLRADLRLKEMALARMTAPACSDCGGVTRQ